MKQYFYIWSVGIVTIFFVLLTGSFFVLDTIADQLSAQSVSSSVKYQATRWSKCLGSCGIPGRQVRKIRCIQAVNSKVVSLLKCSSVKPVTMRQCKQVRCDNHPAADDVLLFHQDKVKYVWKDGLTRKHWSSSLIGYRRWDFDNLEFSIYEQFLILNECHKSDTCLPLLKNTTINFPQITNTFSAEQGETILETVAVDDRLPIQIESLPRWAAASWGSCSTDECGTNKGVQTRKIICRIVPFASIASDLCATPVPVTSQPCVAKGFICPVTENPVDPVIPDDTPEDKVKDNPPKEAEDDEVSTRKADALRAEIEQARAENAALLKALSSSSASNQSSGQSSGASNGGSNPLSQIQNQLKSLTGGGGSSSSGGSSSGGSSSGSGGGSSGGSGSGGSSSGGTSPGSSSPSSTPSSTNPGPSVPTLGGSEAKKYLEGYNSSKKNSISGLDDAFAGKAHCTISKFNKTYNGSPRPRITSGKRVHGQAKGSPKTSNHNSGKAIDIGNKNLNGKQEADMKKFAQECGIKCNRHGNCAGSTFGNGTGMPCHLHCSPTGN